MVNRTDRLNSLLREVLSDVIRKEVKNPHLHPLFSIASVSITKDLHYAKVYVSVIGTQEEKKQSVDALNSAAGFIAVTASKEVVMRIFPELTFYLDQTAEKQAYIGEIIKGIEEERGEREL